MMLAMISLLLFFGAFDFFDRGISLSEDRTRGGIATGSVMLVSDRLT
jgi:hypothetical protein